MKIWEAVDLKSSLLIDRQRLDPMLLAPAWNEQIGRLRQRKPPEAMLDGDFPSGNGTQVRLVIRIAEQSASRGGELRSVGRDPKKGCGVQE